MILSLPIYLLIAIALFISQKQIIFFQSRPGLNEKLFTVFKFKTMKDEIMASDQKSPNQRITRIGRILRKTNLDELPQLFNVLSGTMSLIGPRPFLEEYLPLYTSRQRKRHLVKPGITGWAQVNGGNLLSWERKFDLDLKYVEKVSFTFDIKILSITLYRIVTLKGFDTGTFIPEKFRKEI